MSNRRSDFLPPIPKAVLPLESIAHIYGRCCQPDMQDVDMTSSKPGWTEVKLGNITKEEYAEKLRRHVISAALAKQACEACIVRPQCKQYGIHAKVTGTYGGKERVHTYVYHPERLSGKLLEIFIEKSIEEFPIEPDKIKPVSYEPIEQTIYLDDNPASRRPLSLVDNG